MVSIEKIIQKGKVEMVEGNIGFDDRHPEIKNIKCSILKLLETGLPLYLKWASGRNVGITRKIVWYPHGHYAEPEFSNPFAIGDEYIIFTK